MSQYNIVNVGLSDSQFDRQFKNGVRLVLKTWSSMIANIEKKIFLEEDWEIGHISIKFWDFFDISKCPKVPSLCLVTREKTYGIYLVYY